MTMFKNNYFIITGGPGAGKSSVLEKLKNKGFSTVSEVGRKIIKEQLAIGGNAIHTGDKVAFRDLMLSYGIMDYQTNFNITKKVFFDRGIPELIGYSELISEPMTQSIKEAVEKYRYNTTVFIFPPWKEIYCHDEERKQSFQEACDTYYAVKKSYEVCGYQLIEIPKDTIKNRAEFILNLCKLRGSENEQH